MQSLACSSKNSPEVDFDSTTEEETEEELSQLLQPNPMETNGVVIEKPVKEPETDDVSQPHELNKGDSVKENSVCLENGTTDPQISGDKINDQLDEEKSVIDVINSVVEKLEESEKNNLMICDDIKISN